MSTQAIDDLNALLKNELSAVETYNQALAKFQDKHGAEILRRCQQSHLERTNKLRSTIIRLNGTPTPDIGLGGKFAKLVMAGAEKMGDKAIAVALQADEGEWTADYEWRLVSMHGDHRGLVKEELLPQQQETEEKLSELANAATKGLWPATPGTKDI
jgi:bacterioferritin (cytochrome b1)